MKDRTVFPAEGLPILLPPMLGQPPAVWLPWYLVLYRVPVNPTYATVWSEIAECTFAGYSRRTIDPALWTAPAVTLGVAATTWGTVPQSYILSGASQDVAGYALITPVAPKLLAVYEPSTLLTLSAGVPFQLLPRLTLATDTCS